MRSQFHNVFSNLIFKDSSDPLPPSSILNEKTRSSGNLYRKCVTCFFCLKLAGTPSLPYLKIKFEKTLWNCHLIPKLSTVLERHVTAQTRPSPDPDLTLGSNLPLAEQKKIGPRMGFGPGGVLGPDAVLGPGKRWAHSVSIPSFSRPSFCCYQERV